MSDVRLSKQAMGAVMMALQKSLLEQSDIVPVLEDFKFKLSDEGLVIVNPPLVKYTEETTQQFLDFESDPENSTTNA